MDDPSHEAPIPTALPLHFHHFGELVPKRGNSCAP
jgi:hypothetical protein